MMLRSRGLGLHRSTSFQQPVLKPCSHQLISLGTRLSMHRQAVSAPEAPTSSSTVEHQQEGPRFKAHLDFKFMKDNVEMLVKNAQDRNSLADPRHVVELYDAFVAVKMQADQLRAERNENSNAMKGKMEPEKRQQLIQRGQELKEELAVLEQKLAEVEQAMQREGQRIPNLSHPDVPIGGEELATVLKTVGEQRKFEFEVKDHVTIGEALDLVDFETGAEVSGQKFYYLRNAAALLELALINWTMGRLSTNLELHVDWCVQVSGQKFYYLRNAAALLELALINWTMAKVVSRGFTPIMTPDLVKESVLEKCGFQPRGTNTQVYSVQDSPLCLTGTAEVPLGGIYMDKLLQESELPIKMAAYGHCFRTEAGAAGAAGKGLYRVHQFSKVEMFALSTPEQSEALHQELIDLEVEMFSELGLHFKVLDMPSVDLGAPAYRKFDIEAWMPGLKRYGEISSASNCTDYQSRRLNIRYRPASKESATAEEAPKKKGGKAAAAGKTEFVHTLNATACAVPRMIVAILENFQQEDGSVVIPEVLRPFMGGMSVIKAPAAKVASQ